MSENTHLSSEELATPKTDAAAYIEYCPGAVTRLVVPAIFAREQERKLAELVTKAQAVVAFWDRFLPKLHYADHPECEDAEWKEFLQLRSAIERATQP